MTRSVDPADDATVRAFFAVELSDDARGSADDVVSDLRSRAGGDGVKWVKTANLHVTLRFLGEVPQSRVSIVAECAAAAVAGAPENHVAFDMQLGELGAFPSLRRPRVVTLDVSPHEPLEALASSLARGVEQAGFPRSEREGPFRPHLTLGRVRRGGRAPSLEAPRPIIRPAQTRVEEIVLFRSELARAGPTYSRMERIPLAIRDFTEANASTDFTPLED